jgi:hypothetical protein
MTLSELISVNNGVFKSVIYADFVNAVREAVDGEPPVGMAWNSIEGCMASEFGEWEVFTHFITDAGFPSAAAIQIHVDSAIGAHLYEWSKYLETLGLEFNPLWNVDGTETVTTEYGEHETTDSKGQRQRTDSKAQAVLTDVYGAHTDTNNDYSTTQDNTQTAHLKGRAEAIVASRSDTHTEDARTDTITDAAATDTLTSHTHTDTVTTVKQGNIGVTKSTDLVQSYRDMARFSLVMIIAKTLAEELSIALWR